MSSDLAQRIVLAFQQQLVNAVFGNERIARQFGMNVTDLQTLHLLLLEPAVQTPYQVAERTGLPTSTVTRVLDRLERAGYLRRTADLHDRRRTILQLIPDAIQPIIDVYTHGTPGIAAVNEEFTETELAVVARYLERVSRHF